MPVRMRGKSETALTTVLMWGKERGREKRGNKGQTPNSKTPNSSSTESTDSAVLLTKNKLENLETRKMPNFH